MAQFQSVIAPLTKNNAVIFFFFFFFCIFKFNWPTERQVMLRTCCAYAACIYFSFGCKFFACCVNTLWSNTSSVCTSYFLLVTGYYAVCHCQPLAHAGLLFINKAFYARHSQHTWPLFARFTCVNFDSAKSHSLNRYTNSYGNCYVECNCDLNCRCKGNSIERKTEIASWISFSPQLHGDLFCP